MQTTPVQIDRDRALARLVERAYLEVFPTGTIVDRLLHVPQHAYVSITCSPSHGIEATLEMVEQLQRVGLEVTVVEMADQVMRLLKEKGIW